MRVSRLLLASLLGLLGCAVNVDAHAKLVSPIPFNPNPSLQQVCGVSAAAAIPSKYVVSQVNAAAPLVVSWQIVAADGRGPLTARIDTTAKNAPTMADFKVALTTTPGTVNNPTRVSATPYKISFQIPPGTVCTGPGGTCTLRVASSSNWVACATIKLTGTNAAGGSNAGAATPAPINPATAIPIDITTTNAPPTTAPAVFPTPVGSGGSGGPIGAYRVLATQATSGLEFLIAASPPQVANRPQGVIMFLHGSTASNYANGLKMFATVAQQQDLIRLSVLAPNGQGWNEGGAAAQQQAATMLNNLIQNDLLPSYNIDTKKIFLTGQSSGGGFLSQYFVPMFANKIAGGGAFLQCGAAPPAVAFQPSATTIANFKLHFEITTGDPIWPQSYANAIAAYTKTGMSFTMTNTKPGGHCAFDQQQVVLDHIAQMLPQPVGGAAAAAFTTQDASGDTFQVFSASPSTETRCVVATGLTSCPKVNGQSVQILSTSDMTMVDVAAQDAINFGLSSSDIMITTPSQACRDAYRDLICATHFIPCGAATATICQSNCIKTNQVCSFNTTLLDGTAGHDSLYDCTLPKYQQMYADANGMCAGAPAAIAGNDLNGINGASSYAQPMMMMTLLLSFIGMIFH